MSPQRTFDLIDWAALDEAARTEVLLRPPLDQAGLEQGVADIIAAVRADGDEALRELGRRFDGVDLEDPECKPGDLARAPEQIEPELLAAMQRARDRIEAFHRAGMPTPVRTETAPGLVCEAVYRPLSPVGLYVPGGSAPLLSTVLMLGIPASLAGCREVVLCTPPGKDGSVHPAVLAAAQLCGVRRVFRLGGAQAIAAMGFGTARVPACAKLFGPGNAWVTEAKRQVAASPGGAAQDMPAGPSEVLVIADHAADPVAVCWDLLSQAEHGPDSQALLLSDDPALLDDVAGRLPSMAAASPRADILARSLTSLRLVRVASMEAAIDISNRYAPEHLLLNCERSETLIDRVETAGSVFLGPWTPESLGDYCSGTNHVLPTYGYARAYSGLSVRDFMRRMTIQSASREALGEAGPDAAVMAAAEGLDAHRQAVTWRLEQLA